MYIYIYINLPYHKLKYCHYHVLAGWIATHSSHEALVITTISTLHHLLHLSTFITRMCHNKSQNCTVMCECKVNWLLMCMNVEFRIKYYRVFSLFSKWLQEWRFILIRSHMRTPTRLWGSLPRRLIYPVWRLSRSLVQVMEKSDWNVDGI